MRRFRDRYSQSSKSAIEQIDLYYELAPELVRVIENDPNPATVFNKTMLAIREAARLAEEGRDQEALYIYRVEFTVLIEKYLK